MCCCAVARLAREESVEALLVGVGGKVAGFVGGAAADLALVHCGGVGDGLKGKARRLRITAKQSSPAPSTVESVTG